MKTIELLVKFVNSRPGLDGANYYDYKSYRAEMAEIGRDKRDFHELLGLALRRVDKLDEKLQETLENNSGRLTLENGKLQYITGQYYCVEYRPAACRIIANLIWDDYRTETNTDGTPVYKDGHEMRAAIKRNVSKRVYKNYFN